MKVLEKIYDYVNGDRYVIETKTCHHCNKTGTVEIQSQELFWLHQGKLIQEAVTSLDKDLREQMITGIHPKCWDEMFAGFDD